MKYQDALDQLARETKRAKQRLSQERSLRAFFWVVVVALAWEAAALSGLQERLPLLLQSLSTVAIDALLIWLAWRAFRAWKRPTDAEACARLAADSRFDLAAFETLSDRPSRLDPFALALWKREQDDAVKRASTARAGPLRPTFTDIDRYGIRYIVLLAAVLATAFGGGDRLDRLSAAFIPDPGPLLGDGPLQVEAWATPADYTHAPPVSLSDRLGERVETPPSVEATVRVTGPTGAPRLVFDGVGGKRETRFMRAADGAWEAHLALPGAGRLKIVRFHTRGFWRMAPALDAQPIARLTEPLAALPQEHVSLAWRASDDYGVARVALRVTPVNPPEGLVGAPPVDTPLEAAAGDPKQSQGEQTIDLAAHPYAGMEVEARIVAFDALGQAGESEAMRFTLPEKVFLQPLARASIEIRRALLMEHRAYHPRPRFDVRTIPAGDILLGRQRIEIRDYERLNNLGRAPAGVKHAVTLLNALTMQPQDGYFRDLAVFFGLKRAYASIDAAESIDDMDEAEDILWRTALRAEYGGAADARLALEQAQRALAEALANGAPQERVRQLMQALREATQRYLQAMVQQAIRNGAQQQTQEDTQDQASVSERDIQQMLDQVQRLTEQGRTQEAQQLLQALANLLANMDAKLDQSPDGQQNGQGQGGQDQQMQQSMDSLSDAIGQQRALRDETQAQEQQGQQGQQSQQQQQQQQQLDQNGQPRSQQSQGGSGGNQQGGQGGDELARRQAELRQSLGHAQRQANQAGAQQSNDLNQAGQAMRQAENALQRGDFSAAQAAQNAALDHLRQGADQLATQIRQRGAQQQGQQGDQAGDRDPLGRATSSGAAGDGRDTAVPTQIDPARARQIFDEIRRRAQDPNRPEAEREYLRRLMDRFSGS